MNELQVRSNRLCHWFII